MFYTVYSVYNVYSDLYAQYAVYVIPVFICYIQYMTYYQRVYCYRVFESIDNLALVLAVESALGHVELRRDSLDIYIPEGSGLTQFLLVWADHLIPLDHLDFYRHRIDKY